MAAITAYVPFSLNEFLEVDGRSLILENSALLMARTYTTGLVTARACSLEAGSMGERIVWESHSRTSFV